MQKVTLAVTLLLAGVSAMQQTYPFQKFATVASMPTEAKKLAEIAIQDGEEADQANYGDFDKLVDKVANKSSVDIAYSFQTVSETEIQEQRQKVRSYWT